MKKESKVKERVCFYCDHWYLVNKMGSCQKLKEETLVLVQDCVDVEDIEEDVAILTYSDFSCSHFKKMKL